MKILSILFLSITTLLAMDVITPTKKFEASGDVQDMVVREGKLYAATSEGIVDIFDIASGEIVQKIEIPKLKDFMGDLMPAKIYSVDAIDEWVIFASEGRGGYRKLWLYKDGKLSKIIDESSKFFIKKARLIDKQTIFLALLTNEHLLYDMQKNSVKYKIQLSTSSFSDFALGESRLEAASSDESGIVRVIDILNGKIVKTLQGINVDRVFQLDYKNGVILTSGQDRRAGIYSALEKSYLEFDFLLYSCALSKDASLGAVAYNEENDILVFEIKSKEKLYELTDSKATITKIIFLNENEIIASSDSKFINLWNLKEPK